MKGLEEAINRLKIELEPVQKKINSRYSKSSNPILLIIGAPRSGTTLLLQYLAESSAFSYPTNLLTRFAYAPYIGAEIQQLLFNEKYGLESKKAPSFESDLGKSGGSLGINEFYHFWRKYIPKYFPQYLNKEEFKQIDFNTLFQELASIESVFYKPFVCKGMMLQYNLADLKDHADKFYFAHIKRQPEFVMQSIFLARKKYFGDINNWWSVKPKEFDILADMDVYHQIAGQVFYTDKTIGEGLKSIPVEKGISINYEDFCHNPKLVLEKITSKYEKLKTIETLPASFRTTNELKIEKNDFEKLKKAYKYFENLNG